MVEEKIIKIDTEIVQELASEKDEQEKILLTLLRKNEMEIDNLLMEYYFRKRGQVYQIRINQEDIKFGDRNSGYFDVSYKVGYSLGCSDNSYEDTTKMKILFRIDPEEYKLYLQGEEFPEREPDEI